MFSWFHDFDMKLFSVCGKRAFLIVKRFSLWFCVRLHREALLIHFIHFFRVALQPGPGESPGLPPLFWEMSIVIRFSPWFQLYGEALLIHFTFAAFAAGLRSGFWGLPFSDSAEGHE